MPGARHGCPHRIVHTYMRALLIATFAFTIASISLFGEEPQSDVRSRLTIPRVKRAPSIEDFVNEIPREAEAMVTGFRQYSPGDGVPAHVETRVYVSYDDDNLYVVFVCLDDPAKVRARLSKREDISDDDMVVVAIDTYYDFQRTFNFRTNPLGVQHDAIITEGQPDDPNFDTVWRSEGQLTRDGYVVWMAIPFKSLRFRRAPKQKWDIVFCRSSPRYSEFSCWPYITKRKESFLQQQADLDGLEQISPGRNIQLIPYGALSNSRFLEREVPRFQEQNDLRAGLDVKAVLNDSLALDLTLNPDFSQVESDEPQVTANQRYEVFYPERRPFFIENAGYFRTPMDSSGLLDRSNSLFFSRRIIEPRFGSRLTGKSGPWALGALITDDRAAGTLADPTSDLAGHRALDGVFRLRRDFSGQSSAGVLITSRDFGSSFSRMFSFDTRLRLNENWIFSGQLLRSESRSDSEGRLSAPGYYAGIKHSGLHFNYSGDYLDLSPDFRTELGFIPRVDVRRTEHQVAYKWIPEGRRILSFEPSVILSGNWDRRNRLQNWDVVPGATMTFPGRTSLSGRRIESYELFDQIGFRKYANSAAFTTQWWKWLKIDAEYARGKGINYYPAGELSPFIARTSDARAGATLRLSKRMRIQESYLYSGLTTTGEPREGVFENHISRSRLNYQFTRRLSLRTIVDYRALNPNESLVDLDHDKRFGADVLLTYLVNPGTAFYIGYSDLRENLEIIPTLRPSLHRTDSPFHQVGRQLFVKLSYLIRF